MSTDPSRNPGPPPAPVPPATPPPATPQPAAKPPGAPTGSFLSYFFLGTSKPGELVVFRHTNLFYWWPVWACAFLMGIITYFGDTYMALVPAGTVPTTVLEGKAPVDNKIEDISKRDILLLAPDKKHLTRVDSGQERVIEPRLFISRYKGLGTIFALVLLLVIAITNVHMRGLWSFFILVVIVALSVIFWVAGWWDKIFAGLGQLSIHINMGGYFLIGLVLFALWLINFAVFDRQTYMVFTAGQVRMRLEIGEGETVYDTQGMVVQKQRSDLFRHWILGFGSGDLIIRPAGVAHAIEMPNVLRVAAVVKRIEQLVKEKVVLTS